MAVASLATTSCGNSNAKKADDASGINNFEINETFKTASASYKCINDTTFGKDVDVFTMRSVSIQWPNKLGENDLKALQDSLMSNVFGLTGMPIDSAVTKYLSRPLRYEECKLEKVDSVPATGENCRILAQTVNAHTIGFTDKYIVYKIEEYEDNGGAHPVYANEFLNYDLKQNKVLGFNDIFAQGNDALILDVIKATLCDMYYARSLAELQEKAGIFTDQIFVSHNIYISDSSIVFYYNPYEIAPWAVGPVSVSIPTYNLDQFLTPEAHKLFQ